MKAYIIDSPCIILAESLFCGVERRQKIPVLCSFRRELSQNSRNNAENIEVFYQLRKERKLMPHPALRTLKTVHPSHQPEHNQRELIVQSIIVPPPCADNEQSKTCNWSSLQNILCSIYSSHNKII